MSIFDRIIDRLRDPRPQLNLPRAALVAHWNRTHWERFEVASWTQPECVRQYIASGGRCPCHPDVAPPPAASDDGPAFG